RVIQDVFPGRRKGEQGDEQGQCDPCARCGRFVGHTAIFGRSGGDCAGGGDGPRIAGVQPATSNPSPPTTMAIFLRLLRLLRPHWGAIGLGILLLLVAAPCELFPALVWKYVTDDLIMRSTDSPTEALAWLFSFGGRLQGWPALLGSALAWMLVIYAIGETLGTLSNYVMQ